MRTTEIRERLQPMSEHLSAPLRAQLEELFKLATYGEQCKQAVGQLETVLSTIRAPGRGRRKKLAEGGEAKAPAKKGRGRRRGPTKSRRGGRTLRSILGEILKGSSEPQKVADLVGKARELGWRTSSNDPANVIAAQLHTLPEAVRVDKGRYVYREPK